MGVWDKTTPAGTDPISQGDDRIREAKDALEEALQAGGCIFPGPNPLTAPEFWAVIPEGLDANKPAASTNYPGRMYRGTDTGDIYRIADDGLSLEKIVKDPGNNAIHQRVAATLASVAGVITLDENRNSYNVTGTEAVTSITGWSAGIVILKFNSARTLTYNASSLILKNAQTRQVAAGEVVIFEFVGSGMVREVAGSGGPQLPSRQVLASGSGATYTTPVGARRLRVRMVGAGGGGGSGSAGSPPSDGTAGGATSFGSFTANGGAGGVKGASGGLAGALGGSGGSGSADIRVAGNAGGTGGTSPNDGHGGGGPWGGGGGAPAYGGGDGGAGAANSGAGGAAGFGSSFGGTGGGAGEYAEFTIDAPAATYTYTVGTGGTGGGTAGQKGGAGGSGLIVVDEIY